MRGPAGPRPRPVDSNDRCITLYPMSDQSSFRLPKVLTHALNRIARERGVPKSQVVREALQAYLVGTATDADAAWRRVAPMIGSVTLDAREIERDALARQIKAHNWRE